MPACDSCRQNFARAPAHSFPENKLPRSDAEYSVLVGLRMLTLRNLVLEENGRYRANPAELALLRYYANAIAHLGIDASPGSSRSEEHTLNSSHV